MRIPRTIAPPLTPSTLYILLALAEKPRYGYVIINTAIEDSGGSVVLSVATLYTALHQLIKKKFIRISPDSPDTLPVAAPGKPRHYYELTPLGRHTLDIERQRLERAVILSRQRLLGPTAWRVQ